MTISSKRLSASLGALLAAGVLVPALAWAAWTAPVNLSQPGQNADSPQVAVDADGNAVFVWTRFDGTSFRVQTRERAANGTLSPVQTLSRPSIFSAFFPQVAVDANGNAVFTWVRFDGTNDRIQARARSGAGVLSGVQTLSPSGQHASSPQVDVDVDGDAVFTWVRSDGTNSRIQARARSAAGVLSGVQNLSPSGENAITPQVAVDDFGDATFTWVRSDAADNSRIQARDRSAAGDLSAVQTLSAAGQSAFQPQVAVDVDGDAVFTWRRFAETNDMARVQTVARSAAGVLSAVQTLSQPGPSGLDPQVAVDADGDAVFTWRRSDGPNVRVQARARSATGTLSGVQNVNASGQSAGDPQVAVDIDGDAVFTWRVADETVNPIQARTRSGAGALGAIETLSAPGASAFDPQVAVDITGNAVVTWQRNDRIQAAAGP